MKAQGSLLPEQQVPGLAEVGCKRRARGDGDDDERGDEASGGDERDPQQRAAPAERVVSHVEGAAAGEEQRGENQVARRLFEVESLEEVEESERAEQGDRELQRAQPAPVEVVGAKQKRQGGQDRERVEDVQFRQRFDVKQQPAAPADVRR